MTADELWRELHQKFPDVLLRRATDVGGGSHYTGFGRKDHGTCLDYFKACLAGEREFMPTGPNSGDPPNTEALVWFDTALERYKPLTVDGVEY